MAMLVPLPNIPLPHSLPINYSLAFQRHLKCHFLCKGFHIPLESAFSIMLIFIYFHFISESLSESFNLYLKFLLHVHLEKKSGRIFTKMFTGVISRLWDDDKQFFTFCFIFFGMTVIVIPNCFPIIQIIVINFTITNHNLNIVPILSPFWVDNNKG